MEVEEATVVGQFDDVEEYEDENENGMPLVSPVERTADGLRESLQDALGTPEECRLERDVFEDARACLQEAEKVIHGLEPNVLEELRLLQRDEVGTEGPPAGAFADADGGELDDDDENDVDDIEIEIDPDELEDPCVGLCDGKTDRSPKECLERAAREYGVDLMGLFHRFGITDFLERIRIVNFFRRGMETGLGDSAKVQEVLERLSHELHNWSISQVRQSEEWLAPVIAEDSLLTAVDTFDERDD